MEKEQEKKEEKGVTAEKDEFSEWYVQLIMKSGLIEYTSVSGCYVYRPYMMKMWEKIQEFINSLLKKRNVKNAYFPLLIPESLLAKEAKHIQGFQPEVAWITQTGNTKLAEKLAIRPTSESIMYPAYSKWIRSYKDLPLKLNQWNSVVRWEFQHPIPFLRSREFLWQEGHTAFATEKEAKEEAIDILKNVYGKTYTELLAIPFISGEKTEKEKFAGANKTFSLEMLFQNGKISQGCTTHNLGQNFSKPFNIKFKDKDKTEKYVWQNSWGFSTRSLGIMIAIHSDSKGLVLPPKIAPNKVVIVPIFKKKDKEKVIKEARKIEKMLKSYAVEIDDREDYTPGWKFNEYELKGVPVRIEIGPKDIKKKQVVVVRRDTGKKANIKTSKLKKEISKLLDDIQNSLYKKAEKFLKDSIVEIKNMSDLQKAIKNKKITKTSWCGLVECEDWIKTKTQGAKIITIPSEQPKLKGKCVYCGKKANYVVYIGKSY